MIFLKSAVLMDRKIKLLEHKLIPMKFLQTAMVSLKQFNNTPYSLINRSVVTAKMMEDKQHRRELMVANKKLVTSLSYGMIQQYASSI